MHDFLIFCTIAATALITLWGARHSRLRHVARFGPPPPAIRRLQRGVFLVLSALLIGLHHLQLAAFLALVLASLLALLLFGFSARRWSVWQALRDGGMTAVLFVTVCCGVLALLR